LPRWIPAAAGAKVGALAAADPTLKSNCRMPNPVAAADVPALAAADVRSFFVLSFSWNRFIQFRPEFMAKNVLWIQYCQELKEKNSRKSFSRNLRKKSVLWIQ
jgi:hypothetical protein